MSTTNQIINKDTEMNYVQITDAIDAGFISVGTEASIVESDSQPDSDITGHIMRSGEGKRYSLYESRSLYIKASSNQKITVTVSED